jgi:hypothetical protein
MDFADLVASPTSFTKKVNESETVKLTSKGGNSLKIYNEALNPFIVEVEGTACLTKTVPCDIKLKCIAKGTAFYIASAVDTKTERVASKAVSIECTN